MDKNSIATVQDLNVFCENIKNHFSDVIKSKINPLKEFYTPKEFGAKIGKPYSTVVYMCKTGKLKAVQQSPNSSWLIHSSELERLIKEANANVTGE
jgi:hypothetical protein